MSFERSSHHDVESPRYHAGPHWVALFAAVFTLPLLFVGGSVTSSVSAWPCRTGRTTFGINMFLYDFWNAPFGVRVEHTHRLYGAAVGLATIVLAGWFLAFERRRYLKVLGLVALAAVIVQGILGGTRSDAGLDVPRGDPRRLGQAFFGLTVALCVLTGRLERHGGDPPCRSSSDAWRSPCWSRVRPSHRGRMVPALSRHGRVGPSCALGPGRLGHAIGLSMAIAARRHEAARLVPAASTLAALSVLQILLGLIAWCNVASAGGNPRTPTLWEAMMRTAHQTNGALLVAASVVLASAGKPPFCLRHRSRDDPLRRGGRRMKTAQFCDAPALVVGSDALPHSTAAVAEAGGRLAALVELTKPRIAMMVLITTATGFLLGAAGPRHPTTLTLALIGTGLVAGGASAWNQILERSRDSQMRRTRNRPLPTGRVSPAAAAVFGTLITAGGWSCWR